MPHANNLLDTATLDTATLNVAPENTHLGELTRSVLAIAELIRLAATGQPEPATTLEMLGRANAAHARQYADCTKAETLELLGRNGSAAAAIVRGLTDAELDRVVSAFRMRTYPSWVPAMSVAQTIERFLIDHIREHLENILTVIGPVR